MGKDFRKISWEDLESHMVEDNDAISLEGVFAGDFLFDVRGQIVFGMAPENSTEAQITARANRSLPPQTINELRNLHVAKHHVTVMGTYFSSQEIIPNLGNIYVDLIKYPKSH